MVSHTANTEWKQGGESRSYTNASGASGTEHSHCGESTFRRRAGNRDRSRFPRWRIRYCRRLWSRCSTRSMSRTSTAVHTGFAPERANRMRSMRSEGSSAWPIGRVLEADISGYFDAIVRKELVEMIERRVKDGSILRLIGKWINVGVIDEGRLLKSETGVGQGQVISPLLANLYLHYVMDK